jgi:hypothetical protein
MKEYWGVDVYIHIFLISALAGGEWSASPPGRFTPRESDPGTHWIGGWVTPEPVWTTWRRENSWPHQDSNSDPSVFQPVASSYTDWAIPAPPRNQTWQLFLYEWVYLSSNLRSATEWSKIKPKHQATNLCVCVVGYLIDLLCAGWPRFDSGRVKIFLFSIMSRPALQ